MAMEPHEVEMFNEAVDRAVHYTKIENERLRAAEDKLHKVMAMLHIIEAHDIFDDSVTIVIKKSHMVIGRTWEDILKLAMKDSKYKHREPEVAKK